MIEAVNASISTAQSVRAVAQQMSAVESLAAKPVTVQKVSMSTQYTSQYVELAPDIKPIFILRDTDTGESIRQFPTEGQIRAYQRAQQAREAASQPLTKPDTASSTEEAAVLVESSVQFKEVRQEVKKAEAPPAPLPGQTKAEINVDGDTGGDVKVKTTFSTSL